MPLPTLNWRLLPPQVTTNPNAASAVLDAIYAAGTSLVYADGSPRSPGTFATPGTASLPSSLGTGSAWTWNYDNSTLQTGGEKTACYAYPPAAGSGLGQAAIIAGSTNVASGSYGFKQLLLDSRTQNLLYIGLAKNSGVYTNWNVAGTPFTSGDFTGFGAISPALGSDPRQIVLVWECQEAIAVQFVRRATSACTAGIAGAYIDPLSTSPLCAETDGRLYGVSTSGPASSMLTTFLSTVAGTTNPLYNNAAANNAHFVTFTPGAGTLVNMQRFGEFTNLSTAFTNNASDYPRIPVQVIAASGPYAGQLRQMFATTSRPSGVTWRDGSTVKGFLWGANTSTPNETLLLTV